MDIIQLTTVYIILMCLVFAVILYVKRFYSDQFHNFDIMTPPHQYVDRMKVQHLKASSLLGFFTLYSRHNVIRWVLCASKLYKYETELKKQRSY